MEKNSEFFVRESYLSTDRDPSKRSKIENLLCAIYEFVNDVENGGFQQYLSNSGVRDALVVAKYLEQIGAVESKELLESALAEVGSNNIDNPSDLDLSCLNSDLVNQKLTVLSERFFSRKEDLNNLLRKALES